MVKCTEYYLVLLFVQILEDFVFLKQDHLYKGVMRARKQVGFLSFISLG